MSYLDLYQLFVKEKQIEYDDFIFIYFLSQLSNKVMGLYHPPDGVTNLKYKLLCFLTPNKIIF
jgi:hypothetical protein